MKKFIILSLALVMVLLSSVSVFAGDVPESLLHEEGAKVFLATIENYTLKEPMIDNIDLIPTEKIKGDVEVGVKQSYSKGYSSAKLEPNVEYLVGYVDEYNLYIYEIETREGNQFKLVESKTYEMVKRLENYLNDGSFEKAEKERVAKIEETDTSSISVIGGSDVPTDIKVKSTLIINIWVLVGIGVALVILIVGVILVIKKKSK